MIQLFIALLLSLPFISHNVVIEETADSVYESVADLPTRGAALVLGAAAYNAHSLSPALQDRMDTALEIFKAKKVSKLILSGAPNEVEAMKNYALEHELKEEDLIIDGLGLNTEASVKNLSDGAKPIIVSQAYHLPRALFLAKRLGHDTVALSADKRSYTKIDEFKKREILANMQVYWNYVASKLF